MKTNNQLRSEFRSALESVTPPAPWLAHAVSKSLDTRLPTKQNDQARPQLRFGLHIVAILVLIGLVVAAVGIYLTVRPALVPAHPGTGPLTFPTKMVTASTGWAWVEPSELWRTTDGGTRWTNVTPRSMGGQTSPSAEAHYFLDATHAWIVALHGATDSAGHYITTFRTTDGGEHWQEGAAVGVPFVGSDLAPQIFFIDQDHGWLLLPNRGSSPTAATPNLYTTDDAGLHWSLTSSVPRTFQAISRPRGTIVFSSLTTGWILATDSSLLVTHDGGATWQFQPLPVATSAGSWLDVPQFFDPQHGFMIYASSPTAPAVLLATSDAGSTWVVRSLPGEVPFTTDFVDANHGWAIGVTAADFNGIPPVPAIPLPLYKTDDGGVTWVPVPTDILWGGTEGPIDILDFVDQNTGFAVRERYMANGISQLLTTTDGGRTWTIVEAFAKPSATAGL
jgi:photosystem II stability/assembly factor-like uncharacterized protein